VAAAAAGDASAGASAGAGAGEGAGGALQSSLGDADCCFNLGLMHAYGRGVEQDAGRAARLFQACELRHAHAGCALYLGLLHAGGGRGVKVDYDLARVYLQRAADAGDVRFAKDAHTAFSRLDGLVREAEAGQAAVLASLQEALRPPPPPPPPPRAAAEQAMAEAALGASWHDGIEM
jgi:TPR repeat protein